MNNIDYIITLPQKKILILLNFFSIISFISFFVFNNFKNINNFTESTIYCSAFSLSFIFLSLFNIISLRNYNNIKIISNITIAVYILLSFSGIIYESINSFATYFMLALPIIVYSLKRIKSASLIVFSFFLAYLLYFLLTKLALLSSLYDTKLYINNLIFFMIIAFFCYYHRKVFQRSDNDFLQKLYVDALTGLASKMKLSEDIKDFKNLYLIILNINDFKAIHSLYGANIGNKVICKIAERLQSLINERKIISAYRLYNDEFAFTIHNNGKKIAEKEVNLLHKILSQSILIDKIDIVINLTLGVAYYEGNILSSADIALREAKKNNKDFLFYNINMNKNVHFRENLNKLKLIEESIANDNIVPFYQPIFNNSTSKIEEYECLLRILYKGDVILPEHFLKFSMKSNIYLHLSKLMLLKSFQDFKDKSSFLSVNLSNNDITDIETKKFIFNLLEEYENADRIIFEINNNEISNNKSEIVDFIKNVKDMGCSIAIDNFGYGYSNFYYIINAGIDYIKIDSSLIKNIDIDKNAEYVTKTIVDFSKRFKIKTIAEYVHTKGVYEKVKELDINYSQGNYLGEPVALM